MMYFKLAWLVFLLYELCYKRKQGLMTILWMQANLFDTILCVRRSKQVLQLKYGCSPSDAVVARHAGVTMERMRTVSKASKFCKSLDKLVGKEANMNLQVSCLVILKPKQVFQFCCLVQNMLPCLSYLKRKSTRHTFAFWVELVWSSSYDDFV